jgi:hypothetical protein
MTTTAFDAWWAHLLQDHPLPLTAPAVWGPWYRRPLTLDAPGTGHRLDCLGCDWFAWRA